MPETYTPTTEAWTDERIRELFIDDGGQAEYHDPIDGARVQRQIAGKIFDTWLAARDARIRTDTIRWVQEAVETYGIGADMQTMPDGGTYLTLSAWLEKRKVLKQPAGSDLR